MPTAKRRDGPRKATWCCPRCGESGKVPGRTPAEVAAAISDRFWRHQRDGCWLSRLATRR